MTARHCLDFNATEWCANGGVAEDTYDGVRRRCIGLAVASINFDAVILEFDGPAPENSLRIGNFVPPKTQRLQMYGFPSDKFAKPGLNVTENCWVTQSLVEKPIHVRGELSGENFGHNCSTYGGNSGGPLLIEGSDIALGLPNTYGIENYNNWDFTQQAEGVGFRSFYNVLSESFEESKIVTVEKIPRINFGQVSSAIRLLSGVYTSSTLPEWSIKVQVVYNTNSFLTKLEFWWFRNDKETGAHEIYNCEQRDCINSVAETKVTDIKIKELTYVQVNGARHIFNLSRFELW